MVRSDRTVAGFRVKAEAAFLPTGHLLSEWDILAAM